MTAEEAQKIAELFVAQDRDRERLYGRCHAVEVCRQTRTPDIDDAPFGDEWIVKFLHECDENVSADWTVVIVDDATGEPQFLGSM